MIKLAGCQLYPTNCYIYRAAESCRQITLESGISSSDQNRLFPAHMSTKVYLLCFLLYNVFDDLVLKKNDKFEKRKEAIIVKRLSVPASFTLYTQQFFLHHASLSFTERRKLNWSSISSSGAAKLLSTQFVYITGLRPQCLWNDFFGFNCKIGWELFYQTFASLLLLAYSHFLLSLP